MRQTHLRAGMTLEEIMEHWPDTVAVVLRHHMLCVGCPITAFHSVSDACHEHGIDEKAFTRELELAITEG